MLDVSKRERNRVRRHHRVRLRVFGTSQRPRLNVFRSNAHIYAQVIDDTTGRTLISASSLDKELKGKVKNGGNVTAAAAVGPLGKRPEEHTSELQSRLHLVCRLLLEKKKKKTVTRCE